MPTTFVTTNMPTRDEKFHDESTVVAGAAIASTVDASQAYTAYWAQTPAALNDAFTLGVWLRSGTYSLFVLCETDNASGIITWSLDGITIGTTDLYSASLTRNVTLSLANITTANDAYHLLKAMLATKNGASSGYKAMLTKIWMKQAAD